MNLYILNQDSSFKPTSDKWLPMKQNTTVTAGLGWLRAMIMMPLPYELEALYILES